MICMGSILRNQARAMATWFNNSSFAMRDHALPTLCSEIALKLEDWLICSVF